jgi:hypothetical protein
VRSKEGKNERRKQKKKEGNKKERIKEREKREMLITTTLVLKHVLSPTFEK